jgi:cardiolipin synthase A/B
MPLEFPITLGIGLTALDALLRFTFIARVIIRRTPVPDTLAWILLLALVPFFSGFLYALIGERRLGTRRARKFETITQDIEHRAVEFWHREHLDWTGEDSPDAHANVPAFTRLDHAGMVRLLTNLASMPALIGNHLDLIGDSEQFVSRLIADIDAATAHVHLLFYIWEDDAVGRRLADAVIRAAQRGVTCRVLVDAVGSKSLVGSDTWDRMHAAKVKAFESLPVNPIRALLYRVDLRNHRKIAVIDGHIAYVGSQNITEENFRKRLGSNAGPWIDANVRMRGPAVQALQATFLRDWVLDSEERLQNETRYFLQSATGEPTPRVGASIVQAIPSGPGPRPDAIHQGFLKMLYAAREEIIMTTPYFVPDEATKGALINAALRGIDVTIIVPEVSDSRLVAAASRAHFEDLMDAGIKIRLHQKGLLHSKAAVVDRTLAVIGSANFDQRSFWLNFEITLFVYDTDFASLLRFLQMQYHTDSREINPRSWRRRPLWKRFRDNSAQLLGPLL